MELARLQRRNRGFVGLRIFLSWLSTSSSGPQELSRLNVVFVYFQTWVLPLWCGLVLVIVNTHISTQHTTTPQPPQYLVFYSTVFLVLPGAHTRAWDVSSVTVPFLTHGCIYGVNGLSFPALSGFSVCWVSPFTWWWGRFYYLFCTLSGLPYLAQNVTVGVWKNRSSL